MTKWKPKNNTKFWYIDSDCVVRDLLYWESFDTDYRTVQAGNCFPSREKAEKALNKIKQVLLSEQYDEYNKEKELPKLTVEVFDRPDCHAWARYAAVDKDGGLYFYGNEPSLETSAGEWSYYHGDNKWGRFDDNFDASDWQNSLIERPAKEAKALPTWCKAGEWIYDVTLREYLCVKKEDYNWYIDNIEIGRIKQARKRPFNEKEMRGLVGKVIEDVEGDATLITDFNNCTKSIRVLGEWVQSDDLANSTWKLNSKPCFVLEYLNGKGEWVK